MNNDEKYVLGAMLRSWDAKNAKFIKSLSLLKPEFFTTHSGVNIFIAIRNVVAKGDVPDPITVEPELCNIQCQEYENWSALLVELFRNSTSHNNIGTHSLRIKANHDAKQANNAFLNAISILNDTSEVNARVRIKNALAAVSGIDIEDESQKSSYTMKEILSSVVDDMQMMIERGGGLYGLSTGFEHLDNSLDGLQPGETYAIAGTPGSGKTTLALNFMVNAAMDNKKVLFYSLEMPHNQIGIKLMSYKSGVEQHLIKNGDLASRQETQSKFDAAFSQMMDKHLTVDEGLNLTAENLDITTKKHELQMGGVDLIVVDYLTLMNAQGESETVKASNSAKACKRLAKKYGCPVIILVQPIKNIDGRLKKSDIKQTGQIEQDAAAIMLLYKDEQMVHCFRPQFATNKFEYTGEPMPEEKKENKPTPMLEWGKK